MRKVFLVLLAASCGAQDVIGQVRWRDEVGFTLSNQTDKAAVRFKLVTGHKEASVIVRPGERTAWNDKRHFPFILENEQFSVTAAVCGALRETTFVYPPPAWTTDASLVGAAALSGAFLDQNPSRQAMDQAVSALKTALSERDPLGRDRLEDELGEWYGKVKRVGLREPGLLCEEPRDVPGAATGTFGGRAVFNIVVAGDTRQGYRLERH